MASKRSDIALWLVGGVGLALALAAVAETAESEPAPAPKPPKPPRPEPPKPPQPEPPKPPQPKPEVPDAATDDETALARMLASEDRRNRGAKIVIGWLALQVARRRRISVYKLLTNGMGYGPQVRGRVVMYAATTEPPTAADRELARKLLAGVLQPSAAIRAHKPGAWVQRKQKKTVSDDYIIQLQAEFDEGIYGRIAGTQWVLFSRDAPRIQIVPFLDAKARLDALPQLPALDISVA